MSNKSYSNFVRASSPEQCLENTSTTVTVLSGEEACKIYLEEIKDARSSVRPNTSKFYTLRKKSKSTEQDEIPLSNKDLFVAIQNNEFDKLKSVLDKYPDKINIIDDYGWSLLMIACQANAVDSAKELLKRGVDISVRDKAGNSARSLVIKNRNHVLADVLLKYRETKPQPTTIQEGNERRSTSVNNNKEFKCDICNKTFPDKDAHLSSTIHNISASKGMKIPANYVIPTSNRGYQLMLKGGWDRDTGLGKDGSGKKYPIKAVQKKDRKGLGHKKRQQGDKPSEDNIKHKSRKMFADKFKKNRILEINFRREFY